MLASSQSLDETAPLAPPVAIAQTDPKPQTQTAAPKPQAEPAAKPQPQPAASAQRAEATPQARAFPLERVLELVRAGITPEYVDEMDALGFTSLTRGAAHRAAPPGRRAGVRQGAGGGRLHGSFRRAAHRPARAGRLRRASRRSCASRGSTELSLTDLIALRSQGVTPNYVEEMKAAGHEDLSVTSLIALRSQGVTGSYVAELKALGYDALQREPADRAALRRA